ncbi:copper resistance protein CopC [Nocardioides sp. CER19]|uniref:copper resistance CopC/CopD family protein n=1 Tax=Nocardioides sp. CER19 TaxID=3038538 RepID=UPI002449DAA8|nr:copper resistance protein CopC [Nocardioides sp. CER19]MDH2413969.1 copper resistance protein CopC [Nocardioides sp. CER19]
MRLLQRTAAALALATTALACWAGPADAHAYLDHSNPADGATISEAPDTLRLAFSEHVVLSATTLRLLDDDERPVPLTRIRLVSAEPGDTEAPSQILAHLPALSAGAYRLTWSTLSSDDLHRTSGVIAFGVRTAVAGAGVDEASPDVVETVAGALLLGGTALLMGVPLALRTLRGATAAARRRVRRVAVIGGWVAIGAALVGPLRELTAGDGAVLLAGGYAARWTLRSVGLVLLVHGVRAGRRTALLAGAVLTAVGETLLGHAVAQAAGDPLRVPMTVIHLLTGLGWSGAVVGIAIGLGRRPTQNLPVPALRAALRQFALPAGSGLAIAVVTGAWLASDAVVSADAALLTTYGRTLLVKVAVVGAVCALALANHRRLRGRRESPLPHHSILAEAMALGGLLVVTALLLAGQPATEPGLVDAGPRPDNGPVASQVADLEEAVSLRPNRAGPSTVLIDVFDRRRPAAGPIADVRVRVGGTDVGIARPLGDGHWSVPVAAVPSGPTQITVTVSRQGADLVTATYPWVVGTRATSPTVVSRLSLTTPLRLLAMTLAAATAVGGLVAIGRRGRRHPRPVPLGEGADREPALPGTRGSSSAS